MAITAARRRKVSPTPRAKDAASGRASARLVNTVTSERRAIILEAATRRFAEFGFAATTVRQIADDVNILSGSLYHHFVTKDEMLHEIVRDAVQQMRKNAQRIAQAPLDAEHRLVALILLDLGELTRNQKVHAILANERRLFRENSEFAYVVKAKKDTYLAWRRVVQDGVEARLFKSDIDVFLTILTILRTLNSAADWFRNDDAHGVGDGSGSSYTLDQVIDFHLEFVLSAIRTPARHAEPIPRKACEELGKFRD